MSSKRKPSRAVAFAKSAGYKTIASLRAAQRGIEALKDTKPVSSHVVDQVAAAAIRAAVEVVDILQGKRPNLLPPCREHDAYVERIAGLEAESGAIESLGYQAKAFIPPPSGQGLCVCDMIIRRLRLGYPRDAPDKKADIRDLLMWRIAYLLVFMHHGTSNRRETILTLEGAWEIFRWPNGFGFLEDDAYGAISGRSLKRLAADMAGAHEDLETSDELPDGACIPFVLAAKHHDLDEASRLLRATGLWGIFPHPGEAFGPGKWRRRMLSLAGTDNYGRYALMRLEAGDRRIMKLLEDTEPETVVSFLEAAKEWDSGEVERTLPMIVGEYGFETAYVPNFVKDGKPMRRAGDVGEFVTSVFDRQDLVDKFPQGQAWRFAGVDKWDPKWGLLKTLGNLLPKAIINARLKCAALVGSVPSPHCENLRDRAREIGYDSSPGLSITMASLAKIPDRLVDAIHVAERLVSEFQPESAPAVARGEYEVIWKLLQEKVDAPVNKHSLLIASFLLHDEVCRLLSLSMDVSVQAAHAILRDWSKTVSGEVSVRGVFSPAGALDDIRCASRLNIHPGFIWIHRFRDVFGGFDLIGDCENACRWLLNDEWLITGAGSGLTADVIEGHEINQRYAALGLEWLLANNNPEGVIRHMPIQTLEQIGRSWVHSNNNCDPISGTNHLMKKEPKETKEDKQ